MKAGQKSRGSSFNLVVRGNPLIKSGSGKQAREAGMRGAVLYQPSAIVAVFGL
jgi:hypothetical protein